MLGDHIAGLLAWRRWYRRTSWTARTRLRARLAGATLTLDVDPTADIAPSVDVRCRRGTHSTLRIGARVRLDDGVVVQLAGGHVDLGADCELRQWVVLNVSGSLRMAGTNILSWGTTIHCGERVVLEHEASASEHVTVTDSRHLHPTDGSFFYHHSETAPVRIGTNSWLASKATVLMGTDLGDHCVVGANSVVSGAVAPRSLMVGAPARRVRSTIEVDSTPATTGAPA